MLNPPPHPLTLSLEMHKWSISRAAIIYSLRYSRKNNGHVIPWDLEVVSAWNLKILLTKEIHSLLTLAKIFPCLQNIIGSCDKSNDVMTLTIILCQGVPWCKFQLHTMYGTQYSMGYSPLKLFQASQESHQKKG